MDHFLFHRGHYNVLAKQIRESFQELIKQDDFRAAIFGGEALVHLTFRLADRFKQDNPLFDEDNFLAACSPPGLDLPRVRSVSNSISRSSD